MTGFIVLYFTACMVSAPDTCESQRVQLDVATPRSCVRAAQPEMARWVETHPDYRIKVFRCGAPPNDPSGNGTRI